MGVDVCLYLNEQDLFWLDLEGVSWRDASPLESQNFLAGWAKETLGRRQRFTEADARGPWPVVLPTLGGGGLLLL